LSENILIYIIAIIINFLIIIFPGYAQQLFAKYCNLFHLDYFSIVKSKNTGEKIFRFFGIGGLISILLIWGKII